MQKAFERGLCLKVHLKVLVLVLQALLLVLDPMPAWWSLLKIMSLLCQTSSQLSILVLLHTMYSILLILQKQKVLVNLFYGLKYPLNVQGLLNSLSKVVLDS